MAGRRNNNMAGHPNNNSRIPERSRTQTRNRPHIEPPLSSGANIPNDVPPGFAPLRSSGSNIPSDVPVPPGFAPLRSSGGNILSDVPVPPGFAPLRSSNGNIYGAVPPGFAPLGSDVDNRRMASKRRSPFVLPESRPRGVTLNGSSSQRNNQPSDVQEGSQRNVRRRLNDATLTLEPTSAAPDASNSIPLPPLHSDASAPSVRMQVERSRAPVSEASRIVSSEIPMSNSISLRERSYGPAPQSTNLRAPVPTVSGSSDAAAEAVTCDSFPSYAPSTSAASSSRAARLGTSAATSTSTFTLAGIDQTFPVELTASFRQSSRATSRRAREDAISRREPLPDYVATSQLWEDPYVTSATSSVRPRNVSTEQRRSRMSRRARDFDYHHFDPLWEDIFMGRLTQRLHDSALYLASDPSDPHFGLELDVDDLSYEELLDLEEHFIGDVADSSDHLLELDIDNMSYEELLDLEEHFIGDVKTGLSNRQISSCVTEVIYCSSGCASNDEEDESCVICLMGYKDRDLMSRLKCGHHYHPDCIKKWLQLKNSCPLCKDVAGERRIR